MNAERECGPLFEIYEEAAANYFCKCEFWFQYTSNTLNVSAKSSEFEVL